MVTRGLTVHLSAFPLYYPLALYSMLVVFGFFYDRYMSIIAEGLALRLFAATESNHHFIFGYKLDWLERCPLVRAITEGLSLTETTGTPVVGFTFLNNHTERTFSGYDCFFTHAGLPQFAVYLCSLLIA
jgi:hypothetical protein